MTKDYYEAEKRKEYNKKYRKSHKEELKESKRKYYEAHKEDCCKKRTAQYYSRKNEFHGLELYVSVFRYYKESSHHCKMSKYFSSLENYVSFQLNPDVKLKLSLLNNMRLGKISEQDALDAAIPLTEKDKEYIREYDLKYRPKEID